MKGAVRSALSRLMVQAAWADNQLCSENTYGVLLWSDWRRPMTDLFNRFVHEESGQDLIEYLLLGTLIAIVVVGGAGALGLSINAWFTSMSVWVNGQAIP
jgi:Flp pilus assembly pilin Flp